MNLMIIRIVLYIHLVMTFDPFTIKIKWYCYDGFQSIQNFYNSLKTKRKEKELKENLSQYLTYFQLNNVTLERRYRKILYFK